MDITLTPEMEKVLGELAEKQKTSVELLVMKTLRECFFSKETKTLKKGAEHQSETKSLADLLAGYIGSIDSSEFADGGARMSENTGKKFGEILSEKQQRGKL